MYIATVTATTTTVSLIPPSFPLRPSGRLSPPGLPVSNVAPPLDCRRRSLGSGAGARGVYTAVTNVPLTDGTAVET